MGRSCDLAQGHKGARINPKPRIEGLSECGVERVQVGECVRGDAVEGQSAGRPVQVHSYSSGEGGRGTYVSGLIIVASRVITRRAVQTPGLVIMSQHAVIILPFPLDAFIRHRYMSPTPTPLSLPVAASRLTLSTQHLIPAVKSLWVVRIPLVLIHICHLSVPLREREISACCVWMQCELTGISRREERGEKNIRIW